MKVVASVQAKRSSSRGLVHYIAHSKIEAEKESGGREIFNEHSDKSSVEKINDFLKTGTSNKRPSNDELHHLVISLKSEYFDRLGNNEKERHKSLKEITRYAMKQFEKEVGAEKIAWAASIHRNTNHPHVHIAIQKEYFDKNLEKKSLSKIPFKLLPHYEKTSESKTFMPGILIEAVSQKLDEHLLEKEKQLAQQNLHKQERRNQSSDKLPDRSNNKSQERASSDAKSNEELKGEREVLARAILAKFYLEKTRENLESLENHGDKRRFNIYDEISGKKRQMSLFDLERRAEKSSNRNIKNLKITDPVKKEELRKNSVQIELQKNLDGIKRIKAILHNLVVKENQTLRGREKDYDKIKHFAEKIRAKYKRENKKLPIPNLTPEDLEMLQVKSIEKKDIRAANYFEKVRKELARERNEPGRTDKEIARLKAQQIMSELKTKSIEKQLKDFSYGKQAFPVEIEGQKWTIQKVDSVIEKRIADNRKLTAKIGKVLGKIGIIEQKNDISQLEEIKAAITEKLSERNEKLTGELKTEKSVLKTLDGFYKKNTNPEQENLGAKFSASELAEIESLAFDLKLNSIYQENWEQQKQLIESADWKDKNESDSRRKAKQNLIAGRAIAREILCEIEVALAKEEFADFKKYQNFQRHELLNQKTGKTKFVSLAEIGLNDRASIFEQSLEYFLETAEVRAARHQLEKIVKEKGSLLKENLKSSYQLLKTAANNTKEFKTNSFFVGTQYLQKPIFTPKELITIELRINQTENQTEAAKLQIMLDSVDQSNAKNLSAILQNFDTTNEYTKTAAPRSVNEQQITGKIDKNEAKSVEKEIKIQENKIEILNQERGR